MSGRNIIVILIIAVVVVGGLLIFQPWTYLQSNTVNEDFPFTTMTDEQKEAFENLPQEVQAELETMAKDESMDEQMVLDTAIAQTEPDSESVEDMPGENPEPQVLASGSFQQIDPVHGAEGTATIYQLEDGQRVLRLQDFQSTNGPELHVILTNGTDNTIFGDVGEYIDLGLLKGNIGNQNYEIPDDIDLGTIETVVIYCVPFGVVFSTAPLA